MTCETSVSLRVRYAETDQMGVAYHSHYLIWCEMARTEHLRRLGVRYRDLEDRGFRLVVTEARLRFLRPARYDDPVTVRAWLASVGSRQVAFGYGLNRSDDGAELARVETALTCLGPHGRPSRIPDDVRAVLDSAVADG